MRIVVVGCGKIGSTVIESLLAEGHDITAVDSRKQIIDDIINIYDIMGVCGNGVDYDTLEEAKVGGAELVVATTDSDELNMLVCFFAKKMGASYTVARIRNPEFNDKNTAYMKQFLDISLIVNPELLVAQEIFNICRLPAATNIETFSRRDFEMVELTIRDGSPLVGMSLMNLRKKYPANYLICVVNRKAETFIPDGNFVLESGDHIALTANFAEAQKLLKMLGIVKKQSKNIMILGASTITYYLSKLLLKSGSRVTIIEKDIERCNHLAELLPSAVIINGDGAKQEILLESGIDSADAFTALTGFDEENILISFFASSREVPRVVTKIDRNELAAMAEKLGIDSITSPKKAVSNVITSYARALENTLGSNVETMYKLMDGSVEALEFKVQSDFKYQNTEIKDMQLKENVLVAGIIRKRKAFIPSGSDKILSGDKIIVISKSKGQAMNDLSDIVK